MVVYEDSVGYEDSPRDMIPISRPDKWRKWLPGIHRVECSRSERYLLCLFAKDKLPSIRHLFNLFIYILVIKQTLCNRHALPTEPHGTAWRINMSYRI